MKLTAKDLRIGNFIMDSQVNGNNSLRVNAIFENTVRAEIDRYVYFDEIRPIPLTEEWLLKFGFERGGYDLIEVWHPKHPRFVMVGYLEDGDDCMGWNYNNEGRTEEEYGSSWIEIKYVHQLQNLFFSLCGKELHF